MKTNKATREMFLYGDIGPDEYGMIGGESFVAALAELGAGPIKLRINSPGGSTWQASAAIEIMKRHDGAVSVSVDGVAASAATFFLTEGWPVSAGPRSMLMIHNPWVIALGSSKDLRKTADMLDQVNESIIDSYTRTMKATRDEVVAMMEAETWFTAKEALEVGLVTSINEKAEDVPAAKIPAGKFKHTPASLLAPETKPDGKAKTFPALVAARMRARSLGMQV